MILIGLPSPRAARYWARMALVSSSDSPAGTGPSLSASRHARCFPDMPAFLKRYSTESPLVTCSVATVRAATSAHRPRFANPERRNAAKRGEDDPQHEGIGTHERPPRGDRDADDHADCAARQ